MTAVMTAAVTAAVTAAMVAETTAVIKGSLSPTLQNQSCSVLYVDTSRHV